MKTIKFFKDKREEEGEKREYEDFYCELSSAVSQTLKLKKVNFSFVEKHRWSCVKTYTFNLYCIQIKSTFIERENIFQSPSPSLGERVKQPHSR